MALLPPYRPPSSTAIAQAKVKMITEDPPRSPLIAQPPSDRTIGNASMFHYTVRSKGGEWEEGGAMKLEQGAEYRGERGGRDKVGVSVGGRRTACTISK